MSNEVNCVDLRRLQRPCSVVNHILREAPLRETRKAWGMIMVRWVNMASRETDWTPNTQPDTLTLGVSFLASSAAHIYLCTLHTHDFSVGLQQRFAMQTRADNGWR